VSTTSTSPPGGRGDLAQQRLVGVERQRYLGLAPAIHRVTGAPAGVAAALAERFDDGPRGLGVAEDRRLTVDVHDAAVFGDDGLRAPEEVRQRDRIRKRLPGR